MSGCRKDSPLLGSAWRGIRIDAAGEGTQCLAHPLGVGVRGVSRGGGARFTRVQVVMGRTMAVVIDGDGLIVRRLAREGSVSRHGRSPPVRAVARTEDFPCSHEEQESGDEGGGEAQPASGQEH